MALLYIYHSRLIKCSSITTSIGISLICFTVAIFVDYGFNNSDGSSVVVIHTQMCMHGLGKIATIKS